MSQALPDPPRTLPRWLVAAGSVAIVFHLLAVGAVVLAARSGPWLVPQIGPSPAEPPAFAAAVSAVTTPNYLVPLNLADNGHFMSNRLDLPGVKLEARLQFPDGTEKTLTFPDKDANPWVRLRQSLLVRALAEDRRVMVDPSKGVDLARDSAVKPMVQYWEVAPPDPEAKYQRLWLKTEAEGRLPRNRDVFRPSRWSLLLAKSYARYLCRTYGADKVELFRYTQEAISPVIMLQDRVPDAFPVLKANFGEFSK